MSKFESIFFPLFLFPFSLFLHESEICTYDEVKKATNGEKKSMQGELKKNENEVKEGRTKPTKVYSRYVQYSTYLIARYVVK